MAKPKRKIRPAISESRPEPDRKEVNRPRRRMVAKDREKVILQEATKYFSELGFSAGTTQLARRVGITQPLLYKYFPTKDALLERIFDSLIPQKWNPAWEVLLDDKTTPLRDRLCRFYTDYAEMVLTYEHVRLFLFSGLGHTGFNARYHDLLSKRILSRVARAMRKEYGESADGRPVSAAEIEVVQSLHGAIYQLAFRKWVHGEALSENWAELIEEKIDIFLRGAEVRFRQLFEQDKAANSGAPKQKPANPVVERQVAQHFAAGEPLERLARRHNVSRNKIEEWVRQHRDVTLIEADEAEQTILEHRHRIAALEQLVGRQALQLEMLKSERGYDTSSAATSVAKAAASSRGGSD